MSSDITVASQIPGVALDCDLATGNKIGGGTPTDNSGPINAVLLAATDTAPVYLVLDGPTATSGINMATTGNVTIAGTGLGSGAYLLSNAPTDLITNIDFSHIGTQFHGKNVTIRDLFLNGNRPGNTSIGQRFNISLFGVIGVVIERVRLINSPQYNILLCSCYDVVIDGVSIESYGLLNGDGIHLDGPSSDIRISNCHFSTGDDAIACNAPEDDYANPGGDIERVAVSNCTFKDCLTALRVYGWLSSVQARVRHVTFSNCTGTIKNQYSFITTVFLLGSNRTGTKPVDTIESFTASNCSFSSEGYIVSICDPCGAINIDDFVWLSPTNVNPAIHFEVPVTVQSLSISSFFIYRTPAGHALSYLLQVPNGAQIIRLELNNVGSRNQYGGSYGTLPYLIDVSSGGRIEELVINSVDPAYIDNFATSTSFANIGVIYGPGVLASGWQFPDSVMRDFTSYISATSPNAGKPCIKVSGVVQLL